MNSPILRRLGVALALAGSIGALSPAAHAYALIGGALKTGPFTLSLQLDATKPTSPSLPLQDGKTNWNSVAQAAAADWNAILVRTSFTTVTSNTAAVDFRDGMNSVLFRDSLLGQEFGSNTLAVTYVDIYDDEGVETAATREIDLIVNKQIGWNSYRGNLKNSPVDLKRVLVHELGHALGLDHPDQAEPVQNVAAIMNHSVSHLEILQNDDVAGANHLYGTALVAPVVTQSPASRAIATGANTVFKFDLNGAPAAAASRGRVSYTWYFKGQGGTEYERLLLADSNEFSIGSVQPTDAGSYYVRVTTPDTEVTTAPATLTVNPVAVAPATKLVNLSTRGLATPGSPLTVGFVVTGTGQKTVLIRAVGPTLSSFNVPGTLPDPRLVVRPLGVDTPVATSGTIWDSNPSTADSIRTTGDRVGAFPLTPGSKDAVVLVTLPAGQYTAATESPSGASGVVLVEAYDADDPTTSTTRLANLSTRNYVSTGANVLISGFAVSGPGPRTYLIRIAGETLSKFGVTGILDDPILKLYQSVNNQSILLRTHDDWNSPLVVQPTLQNAFAQVQAFGLDEYQECAMLVTLPPGSYTAEASGNANGGATSPTGTALLEIYEIP